MWDNIYFDPDKFGLDLVGAVDFSDGAYQFDYCAVWRRKSDGALFYLDDSGCSCPSPFEDASMATLIPAKPYEIRAHLTARFQALSHWDEPEKPRILNDIATLMAKVI